MFQASVPLHAAPEAELVHLRPEALVDWCLQMSIPQQHEGVTAQMDSAQRCVSEREFSYRSFNGNFINLTWCFYCDVFSGDENANVE
jgi:hypothetical protein